MDVKYSPAEIEPKWQKVWEPAFAAVDFDKKPKYYVLAEFPYPSGEGLHMGHAWTYMISDIFARKKRMEGFNVLFPIGWDAFGLPTENYAIKTKQQPAVVTKKNTDNFRKQMHGLGLSFNWDREIDTTNPDYYRWTQWIFLELFKNGLAYKAETPVNWCPSCKVVLAKEEVVDGKHERCGTMVNERLQSQWVLRITNYADRLIDELDLVDWPEHIKLAQKNWIGRKEGIEVTYKIDGLEDVVTAFTTRPDTNFGATFVVLAPEHPLIDKITSNNYKKEVADYVIKAKAKTDDERIAQGKKKTGVFTGSYAINPLTGFKMPIWVSDFALMSFGTGAIVGVPGHDLRDFQFATEFGLKIVRVVVGEDGDMSPITSEKQVQEEKGTVINSDFLDGLDVAEATVKIMAYMEEKGWGKRLSTYHIRDWIFSRQHYWGEPTPMIFCEHCAKAGITWWQTDFGKKIKPLFNPQKPEQFDNLRKEVDLAGWFPDENLPVTLPQVEHYEPTDTGESPLSTITDWVKAICPNCGQEAKRETDVMPNWAGSSWYYLRFGDTLNDKALADSKKMDYWMPVDYYFGGAEHTTLHLLYSRFWHKFLNDIKVAPGKEPYKQRINHGMILASDGSKMSKSKGNVVNPDDIVKKYGADPVRVYMAFMGPFEQTMPWNETGIEGSIRFLNRVLKIYTEKEKISNETTDKLSSKLVWLISRVTSSVDTLRPNVAVAALMEFLNMWEEEGQKLSFSDAESYLKLLAPFAPHLTEELWQNFKGLTVEQVHSKEGSTVDLKSVHQQSWPVLDSAKLAQDKNIIAVLVNGKLRATLEVEAQSSQEEIEKLAFNHEKIKKNLENAKIKKVVYVKGKILNFVI